MKIGIVVYSDDSETVWNAFRFGNYALALNDEVKVFLMGKGVEIGSLDTEKFKVAEQVRTFIKGGGKILACGTCLKIHQLGESPIYIVAALKEIYDIVKESDKVVTF